MGLGDGSTSSSVEFSWQETRQWLQKRPHSRSPAVMWHLQGWQLSQCPDTAPARPHIHRRKSAAAGAAMSSDGSRSRSVQLVVCLHTERQSLVVCNCREAFDQINTGKMCSLFVKHGWVLACMLSNNRSLLSASACHCREASDQIKKGKMCSLFINNMAGWVLAYVLSGSLLLSVLQLQGGV
jgi:hypothetical protein